MQGVEPDEHGRGIKPFAINEMSMLAYYHELHPKELKLLPVVPVHDYLLNRSVHPLSIVKISRSIVPHFMS